MPLFNLNSIKNKKVEKFLKQSQKELDSFFGIKLPLPKVVFLNSRKEIDIYYERETPSWLAGWSNRNLIFILHPDKYVKETKGKMMGDFWKTLKHEHVHYYYSFIARGDKPVWLNEGLAHYFSREANFILKKEELVGIFDYFEGNKFDSKIYGVFHFWVLLLINKFGMSKMKKLIKDLSSCQNEKDFAKLFYKVYKIKYTRNSFIKLLEK